MKTIRLNATGKPVVVLQKLLKKLNYPATATGVFDEYTAHLVKQFQARENLSIDGIVGNNTWRKLFRNGYDFSLGAENYFLENEEFYHQIPMKKTIYLHHTAGKYRPDYTIGWWERDKTKSGNVRHVATAFVIGRKSPDGDITHDGRVLRAFNEIHWAHHLGTKRSNNTRLNKESIGIEICSLGPLAKSTTGQFHRKGEPGYLISEEEVCILDQPWRGERYFHKYTDRQIAACKQLILTLAYIFDIDLPDVNYDPTWFELNSEALAGTSGVWTHSNVRTDKTDCFPQPELIAMLNTLHADAKNFTPCESIWEPNEPKSFTLPLEDMEIQDYTRDLDDAEIPELPTVFDIEDFTSIVNFEARQFAMNLHFKNIDDRILEFDNLTELTSLAGLFRSKPHFINSEGDIGC